MSRAMKIGPLIPLLLSAELIADDEDTCAHLAGADWAASAGHRQPRSAVELQVAELIAASDATSSDVVALLQPRLKNIVAERLLALLVALGVTFLDDGRLGGTSPRSRELVVQSSSLMRLRN
ncbi:hypothetical protein A20C1_03528 [marine actinobacterium PHSC20C1]|nr:hypothetical protein A20C1_03528 [marine actinobacterium PHSC20C1]